MPNCELTPSRIPDDHSIWRKMFDREDFLVWSAEQDRWIFRVPSSALQFDPDLSTSWREHLESEHGWTSDLLCEADPQKTLVYEAPVVAIRSLDLPVEHSPQDTKPDLCAHVSVIHATFNSLPRSEKNRIRADLGDSFYLVAGKVTLPIPTGA